MSALLLAVGFVVFMAGLMGFDAWLTN